eukprot:CAMPEP_0198139124 /NCGR_PEP_ID=MMETSP1443-20131203/2457_1 /TAXON_ID=186043 /ORGANISM="Entomoneis sp., Strain CCMP2396" /LENGTH=329 /DNA_ID=CAMNT_0043801153 /DNA_START=128 /DNA_END=1117 /DNA_ORIENTATION=-
MCSAFAPLATTSTTTQRQTSSTFRVNDSLLVGARRQEGSSLSMSESEKKKKSGLDEKMRNKLLTESIAPWRTVRLFFYFSLGLGAFIGGMITLAGTIAAITQARPDVDLNTEYVNLAIDFGAVAVFAFLAKWDLDRQGELEEGVLENIEKKKGRKVVGRAMREREQLLGTLSLAIQVSADGATREAPVREIQAAARQHMILVAGPKKACRDALIGANLLKMDFAMSNVLVVPYETDADDLDLQSKPIGTGFGDGRPMYETQAYVAKPVGEGWDDYIAAEIKDAVEQSGEQAREEGIAVVVANDGKVLRRGIGKVPWRQMVEQLEATAKE